MTHDKKLLAKEFIKRLRLNASDLEAFRAVLDDFAASSTENRMAVAEGLIRIGEEQSETAFDRNFALSQLGMLIRLCGLRGNVDVQNRLNDIIDSWIYDWPDQNPPWGALSALGRVNRQMSLRKCDYLIHYYGEPEMLKQVHQIRVGLERMNPSE